MKKYPTFVMEIVVFNDTDVIKTSVFVGQESGRDPIETEEDVFG